MFWMMYLTQPRRTMIARDFSLNVEVSLMRVMYPHQLMQAKVARRLSLNIEASLMVPVMSLHQPTWTTVAREFPLKILRYQT